MTKIVYQTTPDGVFIGAVALDKSYRDPRRPDRWAIPGGCVELAPPTQKKGFDIVWSGKRWDYREQPKEEEEPTIEESTLEERKAAKLAEIDEITKKEITGGFVSNAKGAVNFYDSAEGDQLTFSAMYAASKSPDFETTAPYNGSIPIRAVTPETGEKEILQHNAAEMQKLIDDLALHIGHCKQIAWQLQEQVKAAVSQNDLDKITWIS